MTAPASVETRQLRAPLLLQASAAGCRDFTGAAAREIDFFLVYLLSLCAHKKSGLNGSSSRTAVSQSRGAASPSPSSSQLSAPVTAIPPGATVAGGSKVASDQPPRSNLQSPAIPKASDQPTAAGGSGGSDQPSKLGKAASRKRASSLAPTQADPTDRTAEENMLVQPTQDDSSEQMTPGGGIRSTKNKEGTKKKLKIVKNQDSTDDTLKHVESIRDVVAREGEM